MNKRILLSLGMLAFAGAVVVGGTGAFFSDTETSVGNIFTAGSVTVGIEGITHNYAGSDDTNAPVFTTDTGNGFSFALADLKPLDEGNIDYDLVNGANEAYICAMVTETGNHDNGINDPESDAGDSTDGSSNGELGDFLNFNFNGNTGSLSAISGLWQTVGTAAANASTSQGFEYCFGEYTGTVCGPSAGNDNLAQTDSLTADVEFYAVQTRNNAGFTCADLNDGGTNPDAVFSQGFEDDTVDWTRFNGGTLARVADGTNGVPSSDGNFYATANGQVFTQWGGYSDTFPVDGYTTEVDVYLDMADSVVSGDSDHFDYTSAINNQAGNHLRDFVFAVGHDSVTGDWSATASNNAGAGNQHLTGTNPVQIDTTGWYTLQHYFHNVGGALTVDMKIIDSNGVVKGSWTLSTPADLIASVVGGNRYGWFATQPFTALPFDNSTLYLGAPTI